MSASVADDVQYFDLDTEDEEEPAEQPSATVTVSAADPAVLARFVEAIDRLKILAPGVEVEVRSDHLIPTFYGWEHDVWREGAR